MRRAPARQVGQAGNEVVDRWVQGLFEKAADAANRRLGAERVAKAREAWKQAEEAGRALQGAREQGVRMAHSDQVIVSPWYVRHTLEQPAGAVVLLVLLAVLFLAGWHVQRRRSHLVVAGAAVAVAVVLPLLAVFVSTRAERADAPGAGAMGAGSLKATILEAALRADEAEVEAASAADGMWQHGRIRYDTVAFIPGDARMAVSSAGGDEHLVTLHQVAPNLVATANLTDGRFEGPLILAGRGRREDLEGKDFKGAAVILDFACGKRWLDTVAMGADVVIFVEPPDERGITYTEATQKQTQTPLSIPRFYLSRASFEAMFGSEPAEAAPRTVKIEQATAGRWQRRELAADWLFIPGSAPRGPEGTAPEDDIGRQVVHVQAYKDSRSIVPALSPGARSAGNLVLMARLIERFMERPPARPVLMSAVNDHTNALLGEQHHAYAAFADPQDLHEELRHLEEQIDQQQLVASTYGRGPTVDLIDQIRSRTAMAGGRVIKLRDAAQKRLTTQRNVLRARRDDLQLAVQREAPDVRRAATMRDELHGIEKQRQELVLFMGLFNRFGRKSYFDPASAERAGSTVVLSPAQRQKVAGLFETIADDARSRGGRLEARRRRLLENLLLRRCLRFLAPGGVAPIASADDVFLTRHPKIPSIATICLDLSFGTDHIGFFPVGHMGTDKKVADLARLRMTRFAKQAMKVAASVAASTGRANPMLETVRNVGGVSWIAHVGRGFAFGSVTATGFTLPGVTLANVRDFRHRAYTPHDTVDRIDRPRFERQVGFSTDLLEALVHLDDLGRSRQSVGTATAFCTHIDVRLNDRYSPGVTQTPLAGALVYLYRPVWGLTDHAHRYGQVEPGQMLRAAEDGTVVVRGGVWRGAAALAFGTDARGRLNAALDLEAGEARFKSTIEVPVTVNFKAVSIIAFEATKVDLVGMTEPLTLMPATSVEIIDAASESVPRHYSINGAMPKALAGRSKLTPTTWDGTASIWIEPHVRFKLRVGHGLVLGADADHPEGTGFDARVGSIRDTVVRSAADMWQINDARLRLLTSKGVQDATASSYSDGARAGLAASSKAASGRRPVEARIHAERASGLAYRSYLRGVGTINDLVKAVILFLMLVIPFCYFLMKLVSPYTDVNRQLVLFALIFVVTALILRLVHPAFSVSQTPTMVLLAFGILGLAGFVAAVLIGRFNEHMTEAVEQFQQAETSEAPRSRLAGVAFIVGVNNMKRRRIRTTLTCVTIVLVTFTMLSVISVGQDVEPARRRTSRTAPYDGWVFHRPGMMPLDDIQVERLRDQFAGRAASVARAWIERKGAYGEHLSFEARTAQPVAGADTEAVMLKVIVGTEPAEDGFIGRMPLAAGRWFSSNRADEIILSAKAARYLSITPQNFSGRAVDLGARRLKLVGLVDDTAFEALRDLGDVPLLPLAGGASFLAAITAAGENEKGMFAQASGKAILAGSQNVPSGVEPMEAKDVAWLPLDTAFEMGEGWHRSISFKYEGAGASASAWEDATRLIAFQHARISVGLRSPVAQEQMGTTIDAGQFAVASSSSTEVVGVLKVMIPIILVATIILNTMLGSVMERRREVSIYNAIGLNPGHVMMFFLAESLVFGVVGSVAGYLIGQGMSLVLARFIDLNLNYSSTSVMFVILLSIGTVLLSTVYPAMMAARAAVPSGQRRWSLPQPEGDEIRVDFPFSYDARRLRGVFAFLHEFLRQNSEASTGRFLASGDRVGCVPAEAGEAEGPGGAVVLVCDIAPAPFDLGVNQKMEVYGYYNARVRAHMLCVHLTRVSGQVQNWVHVNQPFLESLRKRLLEWRSQQPKVQQDYCDRGERLFEGAKQLPVAGEGSE